jgi:hypothetical protein
MIQKAKQYRFILHQKNKMIEKVVKKGSLLDCTDARNDLEYWLAKSPQERIEAVEVLRKQRHGNQQRLQRIARVIERV